MSDWQWHIRCKPGDIARTVLLPGDRNRVRRIAAQMDASHPVAENREYVVYTGATGGVPLSICSTGIGGPAASIALEELANIGGEVFIRVGSAAGRQAHVAVGMPVILTAAHRAEGTSRAYLPAEFPAVADLDVTNALLDAARASGYSFAAGIGTTRDAFYQPDLALAERLNKAGVVAAEMEAATLFIVGTYRRVRVGCIATTDANRWLPDQRTPEERLALFAEGEKRMIAIALRAVQLLAERGI